VGGSQQTVTWSASASLCNRLDTGPGAAGRGAGDCRVLSARGGIQKLDFGKRLLSTYQVTIKSQIFNNSGREKGEMEIYVNCVERGVG
jgi:hypothetical protein